MTVFPVIGVTDGSTDHVHQSVKRTLSHSTMKCCLFCVKCLPDVPALYDTYSQLDTEFDKKLFALLHKGISHHLAKCFEAANSVAMENTCKKLQTCVEDLSVKISSLSSSKKLSKWKLKVLLSL